ncbi:hypothetical protein ACFE04_028729 [Oxalis oulophora]
MMMRMMRSVVLFLLSVSAVMGMNVNNGFLGNNQVYNRKLLHNNKAIVEPNRISGETCTNADIVINQGPTPPLPSGIPTYTVEIMNVCVTGCDISRIHLNCGWFSSSHLINPKIFKRLRFNDCLVNNGKRLVNGGTVSFQYANSFLYPLSVSSGRGQAEAAEIVTNWEIFGVSISV